MFHVEKITFKTLEDVYMKSSADFVSRAFLSVIFKKEIKSARRSS